MARTAYRPARMEDIPKIARLRTAEDPDYGFGEQQHLRERMTAYFHQHPRLARANRIMYLAVQGTRIKEVKKETRPLATEIFPAALS